MADPIKMEPSAACVWQRLTSTVIEQNIAKKNLEAFLKITRRSINSTSTSYRSDLDRVQDALEAGDILTIDTLKARGRADLNLTVDHTKGFFPVHVAVNAVGYQKNKAKVIECLIWLLDEVKVDIEVIDFSGRNVLHIAANACDDPIVILLLLARGADPLAESYVGDLPSAFAKLQKHKKVEALLKEAAQVINTIEWARQHPLMEAKLQPKVVAPSYLVDFHTVASEDDDVLDEDDDLMDPRTILEADMHSYHSHHSLPEAEKDKQKEKTKTTTNEIDPNNNAISNNSHNLSLLLTRQPSISPPLSPVSSQPVKKREPQPLAKRLVLSMKNASLATEWKPSPHLKVVQRANAAYIRAQDLEKRQVRSQKFIDTLRARTLAP